MTRTGNKARATTPSTKSPPNPYPGVPHYPPRTQTRAPHSDTQQTTTCTSGQAKEEKHRHTKATQGTEPNTPHPQWHTFAPPPDMSRLHTFTHQGSPTRLRPTRNNPPQPQIPQRGRQARRSEDRRPMPWRITTSNHPDQQASDPTRHQPQENHPHTEAAPQQDPEDRGNPQQATRHSNPKAAHQHETTQPPHHMASLPPTPTNPTSQP